MEGVPNLAGEPDFFTEYQLLYFRGETRKNEQMTAVAQDLTDDDVRELGAYYASLPGPPAPTEPDPDPALTKEGAQLVKDRHCAQCHLETFIGQGEIARLAGQHEDVIVKALHDYQHGARRGRGNVIMPEIAYSLNEDDIRALAHFMSRQSGKGAAAMIRSPGASARNHAPAQPDRRRRWTGRRRRVPLAPWARVPDIARRTSLRRFRSGSGSRALKS